MTFLFSTVAENLLLLDQNQSTEYILYELSSYIMLYFCTQGLLVLTVVCYMGRDRNMLCLFHPKA